DPQPHVLKKEMVGSEIGVTRLVVLDVAVAGDGAERQVVAGIFQFSRDVPQLTIVVLMRIVVIEARVEVVPVGERNDFGGGSSDIVVAVVAAKIEGHSIGQVEDHTA